MKKLFCIIFIIFSFLSFVLVSLISQNIGKYYVSKIISPTEIVLDNNKRCILNDLETFDSDYTDKNKKLAKKFNISEDEAFIFGSLARNWAQNILLNRRINYMNNNIMYVNFDYRAKFMNSPFCLQNENPTNSTAFQKELNLIKQGKFVIINLNNDEILPVSKSNREKVIDFVVIKRSHVKKSRIGKFFINKDKIDKHPSSITLENLKITLSDMTSKTKPDRNCSSEICKEILSCIDKTSKTIDIAIYGYSSTPAIENAIINAQKRGVKVRLVYDVDKKGNNIYPDTEKFVKIITNSKNDFSSKQCENTMHNKFYIFDDSTVITGSANLSHTDMSGFNSNAIITIHSKAVANYYTQEFEQMFEGKFHSEKTAIQNKKVGDIQIYFSPQDKATSNGIIPLIKEAKKYIYIPTFVITDKRVVEELINAKNRGVDIKVILDALSASNQHSRHKELRSAGIQLKAENWAGKMHSKSIIIDDKYLIIGSMNFSNSGENRNDENMIILNNPQATEFYKRFFLYQWNKIDKKWLKYTPRAEGWDSVGSCEDGIDNNYDGLMDGEDTACKKH